MCSILAGVLCAELIIGRFGNDLFLYQVTGGGSLKNYDIKKMHKKGPVCDWSYEVLLDILARLEPVMKAAKILDLPRLFTLAESHAKQVRPLAGPPNIFL